MKIPSTSPPEYLGDYSDYREILKDELARRCQSNPRYSLRAFSRDISVSPPRLSEVLTGKKGLSHQAALDIGKQLGLSSQEIQHFTVLVDAQSARSAVARNIAQSKLEQLRFNSKTRHLQLDAFHCVSDWYHFAILQLMQLPSFCHDHVWIAKRLGIQVPLVDGAMERLVRLKLIENKKVKKKNKYRALQEYTKAPDGVPSSVIRKFHRQVMEKAILALDQHPTSERDFTNLMMPIDASMLEEARSAIRKFRTRFNKQMTTQNKNKVDQVYCLSIQFFNLTPNDGDQDAK